MKDKKSKKEKSKKEISKKEIRYLEDIDLSRDKYDAEWRGNTFIYEPLFGKIIHLYVGDSDDRLKLLAFGPEDKKGSVSIGFAVDSVARLGANMLGHGSAYGFTVPCGADIYICLRKFDVARPADHMVFMHECLHAAYIMLSKAGVEFGEGAEILARMQEFIYRRLLENVLNGCVSRICEDGSVKPIEDDELLARGI